VNPPGESGGSSHPSRPSKRTTFVTRPQRPPELQTRKSPDSPVDSPRSIRGLWSPIKSAHPSRRRRRWGGHPGAIAPSQSPVQREATIED
jgi:hypothetical protein